MIKKNIKKTFGRVRLFLKETVERIWLFITETFGRVRSVFIRLQIGVRVETHIFFFYLKHGIKRFVWIWKQRITFFCYKIQQICKEIERIYKNPEGLDDFYIVVVVQISVSLFIRDIIIFLHVLTRKLVFFFKNLCSWIEQICKEIERIYKNPEGFDDIFILVVVQIFVSLLIRDIIIFLHVLTRELVFFLKNLPTLNDSDLFILFSIVILFIDLFNSPKK